MRSAAPLWARSPSFGRDTARRSPCVGHRSRAGIDAAIRGARGVPDLAYEMPMTRISCTSVTAMS